MMQGVRVRVRVRVKVRVRVRFRVRVRVGVRISTGTKGRQRTMDSLNWNVFSPLLALSLFKTHKLAYV